MALASEMFPLNISNAKCYNIREYAIIHTIILQQSSFDIVREIISVPECNIFKQIVICIATINFSYSKLF